MAAMVMMVAKSLVRVIAPESVDGSACMRVI